MLPWLAASYAPRVRASGDARARVRQSTLSRTPRQTDRGGRSCDVPVGRSVEIRRQQVVDHPAPERHRRIALSSMSCLARAFSSRCQRRRREPAGRQLRSRARSDTRVRTPRSPRPLAARPVRLSQNVAVRRNNSVRARWPSAPRRSPGRIVSRQEGALPRSHARSRSVDPAARRAPSRRRIPRNVQAREDRDWRKSTSRGLTHLARSSTRRNASPPPSSRNRGPARWHPTETGAADPTD